MPKLDGILETAIHTEDMVRAPAFYEGVLGLEPIYSDNRLSAYAVGTVSVLVLASPPRRSPRFGGPSSFAITIAAASTMYLADDTAASAADFGLSVWAITGVAENQESEITGNYPRHRWNVLTIFFWTLNFVIYDFSSFRKRLGRG